MLFVNLHERYAVAKKQLQKRQKKLEKQLRKKATLAALEVAKDILGGDADPGKTEERQQNFRMLLIVSLAMRIYFASAVAFNATLCRLSSSCQYHCSQEHTLTMRIDWQCHQHSQD